MANSIDEKVIRKEFSDWINEVASELPEQKTKVKQTRKYYVYALCEKADDGSIKPFYIGKGMGDRVWQHAEETEFEIDAIEEEAQKYELSKQEVCRLHETLSQKQQKINSIGKDKLIRIIIKSGLTEYESFMCESAIINLLRLDGLVFSNANPLTNKQNGHSNPFEKHADIRSVAITAEDYYNNYCKKPIVFNPLTGEQPSIFNGKNILLRNINSTYPQCINSDLFPTSEERNTAIREAVRGFWVEGDPQRTDFVFAMYEGRIKGVYKIKKPKENSFPHVYDLWRDDYPCFDKLPIRKKDYNFAKAIYDDLVSQNHIIISDGYPSKELSTNDRSTLYSLLSEKTRKIVRETIADSAYIDWLKEQQKKEPSLQDNASSQERFYNCFLRRWTLRKYYPLEDIDEGPDLELKKYINCSIQIYRNGVCESIFAREKTYAPDGRTIRPYAASMLYLPLKN